MQSYFNCSSAFAWTEYTACGRVFSRKRRDKISVLKNIRIYGKRLTSLFCMWPSFLLSLSSTVRYIPTKVSSFMPGQLVTIIWYSVCLLIFQFENFQREPDVCHLTYTPNEDSLRFWSRVIQANRREWKKSDSFLQPGKNKPSHKKSLQIQAKSCDFILNAFLVTLLHIYFAMFVLGNDNNFI